MLGANFGDEGFTPRATRVSFDLPVRYRLGGKTAPVMLKDLTTHGARIEGLVGLRYDEVITQLLPSLKPKAAVVVWVKGVAAGLEFQQPLHPDVFNTLVRKHTASQRKAEAAQAAATHRHGLAHLAS